MKKKLFSKIDYCGRPGRIVCEVTNEGGYISITGEIIPYRCRTAHICGCIHKEIEAAFPDLAPFMWLHLVNVDGSVMHEVSNSLYFLANDDVTRAKNYLHASDDEINGLYNFVCLNLKRSKMSWKYDDINAAYSITDENDIKAYTGMLEKLNLRSRRINAINDFYGVLSRL